MDHRPWIIQQRSAVAFRLIILGSTFCLDCERARRIIEVEMPSTNRCRPPRKMKGVVEVMASRQHKNNLSELGVNWLGNGRLNASESDLKYKYHVAHLSDVYWGRSKVNNNTPRSVSNPPPWANLDPRVLSPIPDKKKRETQWDDKFHKGKCLEQNGAGRGTHTVPVRKRPASAGALRGQREAMSAMAASSSERGFAVGRARNQQGRVKIRPSSAQDRSRNDKSNHVRRRKGSDHADEFSARGQLRPPNDVGGHEGAPGVVDRDECDNVYSAEEMDVLAGGYRLNKSQESTFREFVTMLVDFDACRVVHILDDAFREAQLATGLQDFTGCDAD